MTTWINNCSEKLNSIGRISILKPLCSGTKHLSFPLTSSDTLSSTPPLPYLSIYRKQPSWLHHFSEYGSGGLSTGDRSGRLPLHLAVSACNKNLENGLKCIRSNIFFCRPKTNSWTAINVINGPRVIVFGTSCGLYSFPKSPCSPNIIFWHSFWIFGACTNKR